MIPELVLLIEHLSSSGLISSESVCVCQCVCVCVCVCVEPFVVECFLYA